MLKKGSWKGKIFRRYDIETKAPEIYGGKRHFVNQAADYARKIWLEMGFKEMTGTLIQTTFWNFDALFTAQDHPVREMQDTFYIKDMEAKLPDKKLVRAIRGTHEKGIKGSRGWQYNWEEDEAKKVVLRTHTTCLSAKELARLGKLKNKTGKFFAMGKCFRNETLDWSHGFEFNQSEGIVIDKNANFRHLLGYLQEFYKKMGFEKIRFTPAYFPYTEPSVEMSVYHTEKKIWLEIGGAGILRPEVVVPLLGEYIPVLAWGPGFDRIIMDYYKIKDLREMYKNDLSKLRDMKFWLK
jgi:phenylalanyl-tRNA synthetase alpha chain